MTIQESSESPGKGSLHVVFVGEERQLMESATRLREGREGFAVGIVPPENLADRSTTGPVDCVVCLQAETGDGGGTEPPTVVRQWASDVPVIVCVNDAASADAALEAGASEVVRVDGGLNPELLARRIEGVVPAVERPSDDADPDLAGALERIDDGFLTLDADWQCTYVNERGAELLGSDPGDLSGSVVSESLPPTAERTFQNAAQRAMEEGNQITFQTRMDDPDQWFEFRLFPSAAGDAVSVYVHDVSDRKRRDERLGRLLMTTQALMDADDREQVASVAIHAVEEVLGFDQGRVHLFDPDDGDLVPTATLGDDEGRLVERARVEKSLGRDAPLVCDDVTGDQGGIGSALILPLGGHGVLVIGESETGAFDQSDVSVAEILSTNATAALDRAERQETLQRHDDVLETVQGMVYSLDPEGRFTLVSDPLADRLGYDRERLVGEHTSFILDDEGVERGREVIQDLLSGGPESAAYETEILTSDGDRVPVEVEMSLLPGDQFRGTVGVVRDRTELERTRTELERERDRFTYLFENLPDPVVELEYHGDDRPIVGNVNQAFVDVFGFDADRILGEPLDEFVRPPQNAPPDRLHDRLARGESVTVDMRRETAAGIGDFLVRGVPYQSDDGATRAFGIYTDITEQKRRQRRIGVLNRILRHNVRNNITVVRGYAQMIADRLVGEGTHSELAEAAVEMAEAAAEIEDLSGKARAVERVLKSETDGEANATEVVEEVAGEYRTAYPDIEIAIDMPEELQVAASDRFRIAVANLVENAAEHNDTPTVLITGGVSNDDRAWIRVADDGSGIPDHERSIVEDDQEETKLDHGSGIGLWVVKWTVEAFGGTVHFSESEMGGAAVELRLPQA